MSIAVSTFRYRSRRSDEDLKEKSGSAGQGEAALWLPEATGVDGTGRRAGEPQASVSGIPRGGALSEAEEA